MSNAQSSSKLRWFQAHVSVPILAESAGRAADIALGACEHLQDTFNDDGSIGSFVRIEVDSKPVEES